MGFFAVRPELVIKEGRSNRPTAIFLSEKAKKAYEGRYLQQLKRKTKVRDNSALYQTFFVSGKYAIAHNGGRIVIFTINDLEKINDPIDFIYLSPNGRLHYGVSFSKRKFVAGIEIYTDEENIKLYSPPAVPDNAFLYRIYRDKIPEYIQFTTKGVARTAGVVFINDSLEEVRKPWYIVEKTEDGWNIFLFTYDDGIPHTSMYTIVEKENRKALFAGKPVSEKNIIYYGEIVKIYEHDNKYIIDDGIEKTEIDKSLYERAKVIMKDKIAYVPAAYLSSIVLF